MIHTDWLPAADPSVFDDRTDLDVVITDERVGAGGYPEIRLLGDWGSVTEALCTMWESGDEHTDLEFLKEALKGCEAVDGSAFAAEAALAAEAAIERSRVIRRMVDRSR